MTARERGRGLGATIEAGAAAVALGMAIAGVVRFAFNVVGARIFGLEFVGRVNPWWSTYALLAFLVSGGVGLLLTRSVGLKISAGKLREAKRDAGTALARVAGASAALGALSTLWLDEAPIWLTVLAPTIAVQQLLRALLHTHRMRMTYLRAELAGAVGFAVPFVIACSRGSGELAMAATLGYPIGFLLAILPSISSIATLQGPRGGSRHATGDSLAAFANTVHGIGAFHGLIALGGLILPESESGVLSIALSAVAPLHLIPSALNTVLVPELARLPRDSGAARRSLLRRTTAWMGAVAVVILILAASLESEFLAVMSLPDAPATRWLWRYTLAATVLSILSVPAAAALNVSRHLRTHALASIASLAAGFSWALLFLPETLVAAGHARLTIFVVLASARIGLVQRETGFLWHRDRTSATGS